jgi:tRNA A37 threonylcarbamoyladenosine synthetase subunit TsaC/SUA5/YrdC
LLPATREVPKRLQHPRRSTIGVRVPDHAVAQALLQELAEPILSSTLMLPGSTEPLNDADAINEHVGANLDLIIDAGRVHGGADDRRRFVVGAARHRASRRRRSSAPWIEPGPVNRP